MKAIGRIVEEPSYEHSKFKMNNLTFNEVAPVQKKSGGYRTAGLGAQKFANARRGDSSKDIRVEERERLIEKVQGKALMAQGVAGVYSSEPLIIQQQQFYSQTEYEQPMEGSDHVNWGQSSNGMGH